jgi:hypothetical protein
MGRQLGDVRPAAEPDAIAVLAWVQAGRRAVVAKIPRTSAD